MRKHGATWLKKGLSFQRPVNLQVIETKRFRSRLGTSVIVTILCERTEVSLLDWIPIDTRLCAVRLRGSCKVNGRPSPTELVCCPDSTKDLFYPRFHGLLCTKKTLTLWNEYYSMSGVIKADALRKPWTRGTLVGSVFRLSTVNSQY